MQSVAPAESGGRKANLVTDMQSWQQLKKTKPRNVQACSLFSLSSLFLGKGKKKLIPLFVLFTATHPTGVRDLYGDVGRKTHTLELES